MNQFAQTMALQSKRTVPDHPMNVMVETSARCGQRCPMCPLQGSDDRMAREEGFMAPELFRELIDQFADHPPEVLRLHYSGEAVLHPQFAELALYARELLPNTFLQMNTGGLNWTTDEKRKAWLACGIDKLTFSLEANPWLNDGLDEKGNPFDTTTRREDVTAAARKYVIQPYRAGAPFDITAGNLLRTAILLAQMKEADEGYSRHVGLYVQHLIPKEIRPSKTISDGKQPFFWEMEMSAAFWQQFGVTAQWVPVASIGGQVDNSGMANEAYHRVAPGKCAEVWTNFVVSWNGKVAPCCVDHSFGLLPDLDLNKMSVLEAWKHPALAGLRERHRGNGELPERCKVCLASA